MAARSGRHVTFFFTRALICNSCCDHRFDARPERHVRAKHSETFALGWPGVPARWTSSAKWRRYTAVRKRGTGVEQGVLFEPLLPNDVRC